MKSKLIILILALTVPGFAHTKVDKTVPIKSSQKLVLNFDYPEVKVQTWDKNEVSVTGTASINHGEHDSAFEMEVSTSSGEVTITSLMKNKESIPKRIVIKKGDQEYFFKTDNFRSPEVQKFLEENGRDYSYQSHGIIQEIKLTIFVPRNIETVVHSKYGIVEVSGFDGPLAVDSKYGGIDASILAASTGQLTARTQYGEILSNLDTRFDQQRSAEKSDKRWTEISANLGKGPRYDFESKYGNVYLRKK